MKYLSIITLGFLLLFSSPTYAQTQTLVNLTGIDTIFTPASFYQLSRTAPIPATGGIAAVFNFYITGINESQYGVSELDSNGNTVASINLTGQYGGTSFGSGIYCRGGYVYVSGLTIHSGPYPSTFNVAKIALSPTFDTVWTRSINIDSGIYEGGVSVVADCGGSVYVSGTALLPSYQMSLLS